MASYTDAIERDFEDLRRLRDARGLGCSRRGGPPQRHTLAVATRWVLGILPVMASWGFHQYPYLKYGHSLSDLWWRIPYLLATACLIWFILRTPRAIGRGRSSGTRQLGLLTGATVVSVSSAINVLEPLSQMTIAIPLIVLSGEAEYLLKVGPALLLTAVLAAPLGVTVVCTVDAIRALRRVRRTSFGLRDCAWLLMGLLLSLPIALIVLQFPPLIYSSM